MWIFFHVHPTILGTHCYIIPTVVVQKRYLRFANINIGIRYTRENILDNWSFKKKYFDSYSTLHKISLLIFDSEKIATIFNYYSHY